MERLYCNASIEEKGEMDKFDDRNEFDPGIVDNSQQAFFLESSEQDAIDELSEAIAKTSEAIAMRAEAIAKISEEIARRSEAISKTLDAIGQLSESISNTWNEGFSSETVSSSSGGELEEKAKVESDSSCNRDFLDCFGNCLDIGDPLSTRGKLYFALPITPFHKRVIRSGP
ncbi:hypothetical protein MCHI_003471 [Candidatus Magnetoovum chiemensis]|nr:hypothetical protein MCHI_003471 [Candidatus Magnetoovum chiemensis]